MTVLVDNKISVRDYVMAYMALSAALTEVAVENEKQIFDGTQAVSKENLAFCKKMQTVRKLLDEDQ